jgi:hypothetical protein
MLGNTRLSRRVRPRQEPLTSVTRVRSVAEKRGQAALTKQTEYYAMSPGLTPWSLSLARLSGIATKAKERDESCFFETSRPDFINCLHELVNILPSVLRILIELSFRVGRKDLL